MLSVQRQTGNNANQPLKTFCALIRLALRSNGLTSFKVIFNYLTDWQYASLNILPTTYA